LDSSYCNDYLKKEFHNEKLSKGVHRSYMLEDHDQLLRVIHRYFTCDGRFNKVYMYHIILFIHFTGKKYIDLPYYLCRILGKMDDKVQDKSKQVDPSLFHFSLIKLLVLEEINKKNREWSDFFLHQDFVKKPLVPHHPREALLPQVLKHLLVV
jgi:hypothetical protein